MSTSEIFLWVVIPYVTITVFLLGHVWRYRRAQFGWTTRSTQLLERRLLKWGSPLFHCSARSDRRSRPRDPDPARVRPARSPPPTSTWPSISCCSS